MRFALALLTVIAGGLATHQARADQYRWCANYGTTEGSLNCYFATLQQCEAALAGIGGFCMASPFTQDRPASTPTTAARRKKS